MKQIKLYKRWWGMAVGLGLLHMGCDKELPLGHPELRVEAANPVCLVGEKVIFHLSGKADYLLFYSGEEKQDYRYAKADRVYPATIGLSFGSRLEGGKQLTDILHLWYSTDFSGEYTTEAVRKANWMDLTPEFTIAESIQTEMTPSGRKDITALFESGDSVWFAWQYTVDAYDAIKDNERTVAYVYDFNIEAVSELGSQTLLQQATANWQFVYYGEGYAEDRFGPNNNSTRLCLKCSPQPPADREAWAISPAVTAVSEINLGIDYATTVKSYIQPFPNSYEYVFSQPGEYEVVFVALNATAQGNREVVQRIRITVRETSEVESGGQTEIVEEEQW